MEESLAIRGIASVKVLRDLKDTFFELTGIDFSFIDLKNNPFISPQHASQFCKVLLSSKKYSPFFDAVKKACQRITNTKRPYIYDCHGLTQSIVPILVDAKVIGAILTCPIRTDGSPKELPDDIVKDRRAQAELQRLYRRLPSLPKDQIKNSSELLFTIINYIYKNEFDFLVISDSDRQFSRNQEVVVKAVKFMRKSYHDKDISLKRVASEVALNYYYFSHIFKDELRITFIDYLTKVRMEAATKLLKNRKLDVNQIAYAVGYQDPNYFSKVFKRVMKTSALDYRQDLLKKGVEKQIITI